ncbi:hypothetical protein TSAR_005501 [Trichomalopsis sarcophagae]|uniref:Uncharacterized protein n=1 Tax=Trichomalopsis sarcophagae TaxID=543379 RepID=A0A232EWS3_9HYME|nr:hypothetical protein TSAR_005501 [Trichomalopsis sarcophagae]
MTKCLLVMRASLLTSAREHSHHVGSERGCQFQRSGDLSLLNAGMTENTRQTRLPALVKLPPPPPFLFREDEEKLQFFQAVEPPAVSVLFAKRVSSVQADIANLSGIVTCHRSSRAEDDSSQRGVVSQTHVSAMRAVRRVCDKSPQSCSTMHSMRWHRRC